MQTELKRNLAYVNRFYGWTDEEKREIWGASVGNEEMHLYWKRLATAFRFGYRQTAENNYMRLVEFERLYVEPYMRGEIGADVIRKLQEQVGE